MYHHYVHMHACRYVCTVDPRLSELIGTWVCSDNWKVRIIEAHTFIHRTTGSNKMHASSKTL